MKPQKYLLIVLLIGAIAFSGCIPTIASDPVFFPDPDNGPFNGPIEVTIKSSTKGAAIYYTLDGNRPDYDSLRYRGPFSIGGEKTVIQAVAYKDNLLPSNSVTAVYDFEDMPMECYDTDGGDNIYEKGTLKGPLLVTGVEPTDYCVPNSNLNTLVEYACEKFDGFSGTAATGVYSRSVRCEYGCSEGVCKKEPTYTCQDNDGGLNYHEKGSAKLGQEKKTDYCSFDEGVTLWEGESIVVDIHNVTLVRVGQSSVILEADGERQVVSVGESEVFDDARDLKVYVIENTWSEQYPTDNGAILKFSKTHNLAKNSGTQFEDKSIMVRDIDVSKNTATLAVDGEKMILREGRTGIFSRFNYVTKVILHNVYEPSDGSAPRVSIEVFLQNHNLIEYYCSQYKDGKDVIRSKAITAPYGCYDGTIPKEIVGPDLTVTFLDIFRDGEGNVAQEYCIRNIGNREAKDFYLKTINLDNPNFSMGGLGFGGLSPRIVNCMQSSRTGVEYDGGNGYVEGKNTIQIVVDSKEEINEANENNNVMGFDFFTDEELYYCNDTDEGRDYYNFGTVYNRDYRTNGEDLYHEDFCLKNETGQYVLEFFCSGIYQNSELWRCPGGCENGACIPNYETPYVKITNPKFGDAYLFYQNISIEAKQVYLEVQGGIPNPDDQEIDYVDFAVSQCFDVAYPHEQEPLMMDGSPAMGANGVDIDGNPIGIGDPVEPIGPPCTYKELGKDYDAPYSMNWVTDIIGTVEIRATAVGPSGLRSTDSIIMRVDAPAHS